MCGPFLASRFPSDEVNKTSCTLPELLLARQEKTNFVDRRKGFCYLINTVYFYLAKNMENV